MPREPTPEPQEPNEPKQPNEQRSSTPPLPDHLRPKSWQNEQDIIDIAHVYDLDEQEYVLVLALATALDLDLDYVAVCATHCRVSQFQVIDHATEIGIPIMVTREITDAIIRFVRFVLLLECLDVVSLQGTLANRSLLPYETLKLRDAASWHAVLRETVYYAYFGSVGSIYDIALCFGLSCRGSDKFPRPKHLGYLRGQSLSGTHKKAAAIMYNSELRFNPKVLQANLKRYTNSRQGRQPNALHHLLQIAVKLESV
jgi:hypothetical protein